MSEHLNQPMRPSTPESTRELVLEQVAAIQQYLQLAPAPGLMPAAVVFGFALQDDDDMTIIAAGDVDTLYQLQAAVGLAIKRIAPLEEIHVDW